MMNTKRLVALMGVGVALCIAGVISSCSVGREGLLEVTNQMVQDGLLTPEEGAKFVTAIMEWASQQTSSSLWDTLLTVAGSVLFAYTGINLFPGKRIRNPVAPAPPANPAS